jgi:DNA-binding MarR family transcriptional regulator
VDSNPIDLKGYFPFYLGTVSNRWNATSSRLYLEQFELGIGEWRVLASIHSLGQANSVQVVNLISMDAGAVSRSTAQLKVKGLIRSVAGKFQGRTKPHELTDKGKELYSKIAQIALRREAKLLGALTSDERRILIELMRKIMSRLEDIES